MSRHFTLEEFFRSSTSKVRNINNDPPQEVMVALAVTMAGADRIRILLDRPMFITSGYRCPKLNAAVGGSKNSQHMIGEAFDFVCESMPADQVAEILKASIVDLGIDQLILEHGWVHVSFSDNPRNQALQYLGDGIYVPL